MELPHLRTFLAVYRAGNLTAAARTLHLSQPAVSAQLRALESSLGRPLFVRRARGVTPTPLADTLAGEVAAPLDALDSVAGTYAPGVDPFDGTCVLGGPTDALAALVLPALVPLTTQGLRLRVRTGLPAPLLAALAAGELDVVVTTTPSRPRNVTLVRLVDERLQLVGAPTLSDPSDPSGPPPSGAGETTPDLLSRLPLLGYDERVPLVSKYYREQFPGTEPPPARVVVDDLRALLALARAGAGWTVLPDYLAGPDLTHGSLRLLHQPPEIPTNTLYLAVRTARREHPVVRAVLAQLHSALTAAPVRTVSTSSPG